MKSFRLHKTSTSDRARLSEGARLIQRGRQLLLAGGVMVAVTLAAFLLTWRWEVATKSYTDFNLPGLLTSMLMITAGPIGAICVIVGFVTYLKGRYRLRAESEPDDI